LSVVAGQFRRLASVVIACSALLAVAADRASASSGPLKWSAPSLVDELAPFSIPAIGHSISCPTTTFCVSVGDLGAVKTSTNPTGGAGAWKVTLGVDQGTELTRVSCPSTTLCVALDSRGEIISSNSPAGGPTAWKATNLHSQVLALGGISCPSVSLCVAVGYTDPAEKIAVETSTNPTGGAASWKRTVPAGSLTAGVTVSCPSTSLCVAVDGGGQVATSTNPGAAAPSWSTVSLPGGPFMQSLACGSSTLCLAADINGNLFASTNPSGGAGSWTSTPVDAGGKEIEDVSCPSATFCVAVDSAGDALVAGNPAGGPAAWTHTHVSAQPFSAVACSSNSICVAEDDAAEIAGSASPGAAGAVWAVTAELGGVNRLASLSCPARSLCAIGDDAGNVLTSSHPGADPSAWVAKHLAARDWQIVNDVSCPSVSFCVDVGGHSAATSTNPMAATPRWKLEALEPIEDFRGDPVDIGPVSCASRALCVAAGDVGFSVSSDPAGGASAWRQVHVGEADFDQYTDVACPSKTLCVAGDLQSGRIVHSTTPLVQGSWKFTKLAGEHTRFSAASCADRRFCVVVADSGEIFASTHPTGRASAWRRIHVAHEDLTAVSCPSKTLCVAIDRQDKVLVSTNPAVPNPRYKATTIDRPLGALSPPDALSSVACAPGGPCVVGDVNGNIVIGLLARATRPARPRP
jgi:hypothetical protein